MSFIILSDDFCIKALKASFSCQIIGKDSVLKIILGFCETYEKLCQKKYPEAPLPLEILKSTN